ncbi:hypothetical protein [Ancylomarina sp.]|uniref:hypothetical protein n=1 Tax=Ancylomarina sp. TaxID=1970196 RepID=UPI0035694FCA
MNKSGSYVILEKEQIIIEYHSGEINVDDIINSRKVISSNPDYNPNFNIVLDIRDASMNLSPHDVARGVAFIKKFNILLGERKSAFLTSSPNHVVITTLFSRGLGGFPIKPRVFSTEKAAFEWSSGNKYNTDYLKELKTHPNILYK